ncbi:MAG: phosphoribosylformylglycinamidine synthase subunit PurL [Candidatus Omnitrophica bacterium]|nr:phosphoribosylformylglycinamidine synthase subunit PurL [Candidatus Omnitrophota bacterium]
MPPLDSTAPITPELIDAHGITPDEFARIQEILGRDPNLTELGMFSVMWSEHCSYKNSKPILKLFSQMNASLQHQENLLVKPGQENAGIVDIGDGLAVCFKIESHNHPSAIEPFQGAATGVGGILRDIFTMGARPILLMNSLRFGDLSQPVSRHLFRGVVAGIAHYGNCMGIPTIGGDIYFDPSYEGNPLVNAMALGIIRKDEIVRGAARGVGNPVYYVGATTGRDGLGGAAFASKELSEQSHEDRPAVQVGDPFMEKLLMEACLELLKTDALVGMQDMGAAGLTCAGCETASRASTGVEIDLRYVPRRESGMVPYEILLSESQERMLVIVKKGKEKEVERIFDKWDLHAVRIGTVTSDDKYRVLNEGQVAAEIPAKALADEGPVYVREEAVPAYLREVERLDLDAVPEPEDYRGVLKRLLTHPSLASKAWAWEQYDHMVRTDTVFYPGHDAALVRVKGTQKGIAVSTDCNSLYVYLDPFEGGKTAVAEAARNVVCSGAKPIGLTNCLNFGNPMKPEIFWQFHQAVSGIIESCAALEIPVTGGNVSFYNENPQGAIYPTPTIGMVGLLPDIDKRIPSGFQNEGDIVFLAGETYNEIGGSHYLMIERGLEKGRPPQLDLKREKALQRFILDAADGKKLVSCHDLSEGGLALALAECCLKSGRGLGASVHDLSKVRAGQAALRSDALYFGESQSRVVLSVREKHRETVVILAREKGVPLYEIGKVGGDELVIEDKIRLPVQEMKGLFNAAIPDIMEVR